MKPICVCVCGLNNTRVALKGGGGDSTSATLCITDNNSQTLQPTAQHPPTLFKLTVQLLVQCPAMWKASIVAVEGASFFFFFISQ